MPCRLIGRRLRRQPYHLRNPSQRPTNLLKLPVRFVGFGIREGLRKKALTSRAYVNLSLFSRDFHESTRRSDYERLAVVL
jgi:hypothetical protein